MGDGQGLALLAFAELVAAAAAAFAVPVGHVAEVAPDGRGQRAPIWAGGEGSCVAAAAW